MFLSLYGLDKEEKWTETAVYIYLSAIILYLLTVLILTIAWVVYICIRRYGENRIKEDSKSSKIFVHPTKGKIYSYTFLYFGPIDLIETRVYFTF